MDSELSNYFCIVFFFEKSFSPFFLFEVLTVFKNWFKPLFEKLNAIFVLKSKILKSFPAVHI